MSSYVGEGRGSVFILQWHTTALCDMHCAHCYMYESSTYAKELLDQLSLEDCFGVIDDFADAVNTWGFVGRINFTGGDPLLRTDIFDMLSYARKKGLMVGILGNPHHVTAEIAEKLKRLGICSYQVSIDGMRETHDNLRGRAGSFDETIRALRRLNEVGIRTVVMFTLSKANMNEIAKVIRLAAEENVSVFDFGRLVPIGSGAKLGEEMLDPTEFRDILLTVLEEYRLLKEQGCCTMFGRKENLWYLLYKQLGLFRPPIGDDGKTVYSGCAIGVNLLTLLADGTVLPCRRFPKQIGKVPGQSIKELFIESEELNRMRNIEAMKKCGQCELLHYCRGGPCVAHGAHGSYFAPDPQCWK